MKQATKKKLKKAVWYVPATVCLAASICSVYKFSQAYGEQVDYEEAKDSIYMKVMSSNEFRQFEDDYLQALHNAHKSGALTTAEYYTKLAEVRSQTTVWENREKYMSDEDEQAIITNREGIYKTADEMGFYSSISAVEFALAGALYAGGVDIKKYKDKEEDCTM